MMLCYNITYMEVHSAIVLSPPEGVEFHLADIERCACRLCIERQKRGATTLAETRPVRLCMIDRQFHVLESHPSHTTEC